MMKDNDIEEMLKAVRHACDVTDSANDAFYAIKGILEPALLRIDLKILIQKIIDKKDEIKEGEVIAELHMPDKIRVKIIVEELEGFE